MADTIDLTEIYNKAKQSVAIPQTNIDTTRLREAKRQTDESMPSFKDIFTMSMMLGDRNAAERQREFDLKKKKFNLEADIANRQFPRGVASNELQKQAEERAVIETGKENKLLETTTGINALIPELQKTIKANVAAKPYGVPITGPGLLSGGGWGGAISNFWQRLKGRPAGGEQTAGFTSDWATERGAKESFKKAGVSPAYADPTLQSNMTSQLMKLAEDMRLQRGIASKTKKALTPEAAGPLPTYYDQY